MSSITIMRGSERREERDREEKKGTAYSSLWVRRE